MKSKKGFLFFLFLSMAVLLGFVHDDNPYFIITKKDVRLNWNKKFPKPLYAFEKNKITPEIFVLGRSLFYDDLLSKDNTVSCGSCHQQIAAFAHIDHKLSHGIYGRIGKRNIPSLQNLIWNPTFMWDGGINHIEVQPIGPITNRLEMDESLAGVILKLKKSEKYKELFNKAYKDTLITSERMLKSLAQFMGLMISDNSRYDQYIAGKEKFTAEEEHGLDLFRNNCASCHTEPLFTDQSYRNNGIEPDSKLNDLGRATITSNDSDNYLFKVPTLRNIERTYPYMHDGRFGRLKEVLNHYGTAGNHAKGSDKSIENINLSFEEKKDIIAFLLTLTDKEFLTDRRFRDPNFSVGQ